MRRTAIALGVGVMVLAGCSTNGSAQSVAIDSGQAAVSDDFRIAQSEVADDVSQVLSDQGQPPGEPPPGLASCHDATARPEQADRELRRDERHRADPRPGAAGPRAAGHRERRPGRPEHPRPAVGHPDQRPRGHRAHQPPGHRDRRASSAPPGTRRPRGRRLAWPCRSTPTPSTSRCPRATGPGMTPSCRSSPARR